MRYLILLLALLAAPAWGSGWETCEDMTGNVEGTIAAYQERCTDFASGDLQSTMLYVGTCDNIDVIYNADSTGSNTNVSIQVMTCVMNTVSTDNCLAMDNATLTGIDSSFEILGGAASYIYIQGTGTIGTDTPRTMVRCNK